MSQSRSNWLRIGFYAFAIAGASSLAACAQAPTSNLRGGYADVTEAEPEEPKVDAGKPKAPTPKTKDGGVDAAPKTPPSTPQAPPTPPPVTPDAGGPATGAAPEVTLLQPTNVKALATETPLTVLGSGFLTGAKLKFGTTDLTTTFNGPGSLSAKIPAALLATPGSVNITVVNPAPSVATSAPVAFTIASADVTITTINPNKASAGSADVALTVTGNGFTATAKVNFNGKPLGTTFVSATSLTASIPASALTTAGSFPVTVAGGTSVSAPISFTVEDSKPSFDTFAPGELPAGSPSTTATLTGRGFTPTTKAAVNGYIAQTTFVSATQIKAVIPSYDLDTAGTNVTIRIYNTDTAGTVFYATSIGELSVTAVAGTPPGSSKPVFSTYTPSYVFVGGDAIYVTIAGSGFNSTTGVSIGGYVATVVHDSTTQIRAILTAANQATATTLKVRVYNDAGAGSAYYADLEGTIDVF